MSAGRYPPVVGFVGPKNSGKTTLLVRMLPIWRADGLRVGAVKHSHHVLTAGDPHVDDQRLRAAGAAAVVACEAAVPWSAAVDRVLAQAPDLDFIVLEGYHAAPVVQVLVLARAEDLASELARVRGWVVAGVAPASPRSGTEELAVPWWARDDVRGLAAFVAGSCRAVTGPGTRVAAAVLAGGASRRMGTDKAALLWQGHTWLERARRAAGEATGAEAMVVGGRGDEPWRVPDLLPGQGPLAALVAAWYHSRAAWVLLCACDMPLLDGPALAVLLEHVSDGGEAAAVIPVIGGRRQYTCAVYARSALASAVAALGAGTRGLRAWIDTQVVREVGEDAWRARGIDPNRTFADFDDPGALETLGRGG